jgi:hypothetical protein
MNWNLNCRFILVSCFISSFSFEILMIFCPICKLGQFESNLAWFILHNGIWWSSQPTNMATETLRIAKACFTLRMRWKLHCRYMINISGFFCEIYSFASWAVSKRKKNYFKILSETSVAIGTKVVRIIWKKKLWCCKNIPAMVLYWCYQK